MPVVNGYLAHIHWLRGEPNGIYADHCSKSRRTVVQAAFSVGQFILTSPRECWISIPIFDDTACEFASVNGHGERNKCRLQRGAFLRLQPNPFVEEVCVEAMAECDAGNRSAELGTFLNNLGF